MTTKTVIRIIVACLILFLAIWGVLTFLASMFAFAHFTFKWAFYIAGAFLLYFVISAIVSYPKIKAEVEQEFRDKENA